MDEQIRQQVQEINVLLAELQRKWRGQPEYDKLDRIMEILNGDIIKELKRE